MFNNDNIVFGKVDNIAFDETYKLKSSYYTLLNPDICFDPSIIECLLNKAGSDSSIKLIISKIKCPEGLIKCLSKLIPIPKDLLLMKFTQFKVFKAKFENRYDLKFS
jgi:GT2 family glycosyltransferase